MTLSAFKLRLPRFIIAWQGDMLQLQGHPSTLRLRDELFIYLFQISGKGQCHWHTI